jgi:hypothetical protein
LSVPVGVFVLGAALGDRERVSRALHSKHGNDYRGSKRKGARRHSSFLLVVSRSAFQSRLISAGVKRRRSGRKTCILSITTCGTVLKAAAELPRKSMKKFHFFFAA